MKGGYVILDEDIAIELFTLLLKNGGTSEIPGVYNRLKNICETGKPVLVQSSLKIFKTGVFLQSSSSEYGASLSGQISKWAINLTVASANVLVTSSKDAPDRITLTVS